MALCYTLYMPNDLLITRCNELLKAYKKGLLGQTVMPEDSHPSFKNVEERLIYFTLPMALNYQRNSYTLWKSALDTYKDRATQDVFDLRQVQEMEFEKLQNKLLKHRLALQPNKHPATWQKLAHTITKNWGGMQELFKDCDSDYLVLRDILQKRYKKDFPYLSGPKIFNYWCFIMGSYGGVELKNRQFIEIAPDTHVTKCSVKLGVISAAEAQRLSKEQISARWREALDGSDITPIDMHPPLWFWSRNGFKYHIID